MIQISQGTISFSLAVLGSVLGILNTWRAMNKDKVKLKVLPKRAYPVGIASPMINFSIEVINLSSFPVTVNETGFLLKNTTNRAVIIDPITTDRTKPPFRLEPRASITTYVMLDDNIIHSLKVAYAKTACGYEIKGKSPALKV